MENKYTSLWHQHREEVLSKLPSDYQQRQAHWERLRQEALEKSQQLAEQREQARIDRLDELTKLYGSSESAYAKRVTYSSLSREAKEQIRAEAIETLKTTDMTQAEVAKQFGVSQNAINTWARAAGIPKHGSRAWNEARRKRHSEKLKAAMRSAYKKVSHDTDKS
jgi:transposase-like protein